MQQTLHTPFPSHSIEAYYPGAGLGAVGRGEEGGYGVRCFHPFTTLLFKHRQPKASSLYPCQASTKMKILNKIRSNSVSQYPRFVSPRLVILKPTTHVHGKARNTHQQACLERRLVGISLRKPSKDQAFYHIASTSIFGIAEFTYLFLFMHAVFS